MSKLSSFLNKAKKKAPTAAPAGSAETLKPAAVTADATKPTEAAHVPLDVVQTKVLEQWGTTEEDELIEPPEVPAVTRPPQHESDEDEELQLPSAKTQGNFEWKRETEEEAKKAVVPAVTSGPTEEARKTEEVSTLGGFLRRKPKAAAKAADIDDTEQFPVLIGTLPDQPAPSPGVSPSSKAEVTGMQPVSVAAAKPKKKPAASLKEVSEAAMNEVKAQSLEKLAGVFLQWPSGWPSTAGDKELSQARYARMLPA